MLRCMLRPARHKNLAGLAARCPCCIAPTTRSKRSRRVNSCLAASQEARLLYLQKLPRRWPLLRTVCIKFPRLGNLVHKPA